MSVTASFYKTIQDIKDTYYMDGTGIQPSESNLKKIASDLEEMKLAGLAMRTGSLIGLGASYLVTYIPRVGRPLGVMGGITFAAIGFFGFEIGTAADNLRTYKTNEFKNLADTEKEFEDTLKATASKGTLFGNRIASNALASKQK